MSVLTAGQAHALLDILTHCETYSAEIELFKTPGVISHYGPPFQPESTISKTPLLQKLFSTFVVPIPGLRDVEPEFWTKRVQPLVDDLAKANLSESYDKGGMGIRKTLATAISALIEYPARGVLGGLPGRDLEYDPSHTYDVRNQQDLADAFRQFLQQVVYGDLLDELFDKAAESDDLQAHSQMVIAAHQHIVVNLASLVHYVLVTSPKGQMLLSLIERTNRLIPYRIIRQTLRVGNAATMVSGMVRLVLAKMSIGAVTNWIGLSTGADEGMNLLQTIIYTVLSWDIRELESRRTKLEKSKDTPSKDQLAAVAAYIKLNREEQEAYRETSKSSSMSIVHTILTISPSNPSKSLTADQHRTLLEYLSIQLSIRDREQLINVLCRSNPDNLTIAIRDVVAIYDPIIRNLHNAVDLSGTVSDFERFVNDMIKTAKIPDTPKQQHPSSSPSAPGVEEFVALFERHQKSCHVFLHQFCKNGAKATELWRDYAKYAVKQFRQPDDATTPGGAGGFAPSLDKLVMGLNEEDRKTVIAQMETYEDYLRALSKKTDRRMASIVAADAAAAAKATAASTPKKQTKKGPGNFLFKWQELLDSTQITPSVATGGNVRTGKDSDVKAASGADFSGERKQAQAPAVADTNGAATVGEVAKETAEMPDVARTVELLLPQFKEVLANGH
ncbi:hypothetical protein DRE_06658 [Drechslerella stenobrocha 248]|uniref:PX domain-containing protein n=1 Tax=Drechslerella stenobrocha 248 TaxID=1043628 RepID=W7HWX7_9PEZI|nr:hypothetical protein DRE_06658 [Drechslerella stenobrocha 248]